MANKVPERRSAKDDSTPMDDADINLVIEAMYQVAADPERWDQLVDALGEVPGVDETPTTAVRGLAHSQEIARMLGRSRDGQAAPTTPPTALGWVVLNAAGKITAANPPAHAVMMTSGLGQLRIGSAIAFDDPNNDEALARALMQSRGSHQSHAILKLERQGDLGPCFAYVVPAGALPGLVGEGIPQLILDAQSYAVVFPAVEETQRLWTSIRESFGLTPAEIRLTALLGDGRTLAEAAEDLSVSINTVRNQLRAIFDKMGLKRQGDLIRVLGDLTQMARVLETIPGGQNETAEAVPVLRDIRLSDGRRLSYREYGISNGRPLLMFHEGMGSSLLPPGVHTLAKELGLRVLCAERPGFGQSDPRDDYSFDGVADDMVELCDQLGVEQVRIAAILSGGPSAMQTAIRLGDRAAGVLLCSARPPRPDLKSGGVMTQFRQRLQRNPWVIDSFYAILRLRMSNGMTPSMMQTATAESPGDRIFINANPWVGKFMSAYVGEALALGCRGPSDEMKAFHRAGNLNVEDLKCRLVVWHGEHDHFAPLADLMEYLGDRADEVRVVPRTGHLMALQLWDEMLRHAAS